VQNRTGLELAGLITLRRREGKNALTLKLDGYPNLSRQDILYCGDSEPANAI
jgi:hypothetical protein